MPDNKPDNHAESAHLAEHMINLEVKISHQDIAIEELKQTVYDQHLLLEKIVKDLKHLKDRFDGFDGGQTIGPGNERPPHY